MTVSSQTSKVVGKNISYGTQMKPTKLQDILGRMRIVEVENVENQHVFHHSTSCIVKNRPFLQGLRPVVFLGRLFGVLSKSSILNERDQKRRFTAASVYSACLSFFILVNAILLVALNFKRFKQDKTVLVKVEGFHHAVYTCSMSFVYCYQFFATSKLRKLVQDFAHEDSFESNDRGAGFIPFTKFCFLCTFTCLVLGMIENGLFDWQNLTRGGYTNASVLELSYSHYFTHWHVVLPKYNAGVVFILLIFIKLGTWGWLHMDTICIVLCRAIWEKLRGLNDIIMKDLGDHHDAVRPSITESQGEQNGTINSKQSRGDDGWETYQRQYVKITELVSEVEEYICPLILACYAGNIYIIIVMLFNWIGPLSDDVTTKEQMIHICFAFFQYSFRVAAITYFAAEVNQMSLQIRRRVQICPDSIYCMAVERLERSLMGNPTGICLLGSFVISRKYFISIISFIFTAEIVLLQTYSTYVAPVDKQ